MTNTKWSRSGTTIAGVILIIVGAIAAGPTAVGYAFSPNKTAPCIEQQGLPASATGSYERADISLWPLGTRCRYPGPNGSTIAVDPGWDLSLGVYGGLVVLAGGIVLVSVARRGLRERSSAVGPQR